MYYYDEINQKDVRSLESMIDAAVRGILSAFGAISFNDLLDQVCFQLALSATKYVIEATKDAYNYYIDKKKNR